MSAFKPRDRISFPIYDQRFRGTVQAVNPDGSLQVKLDIPNGHYYLAVNNPEQAKKLRVKPRAERRRVWIPATSLPHDMITKTEDAGWISAEPRSDWVEFIEVRRRK